MNKEVLEKLNALVIAAFGLVAALAWNTAIQEIFKRIFGTASSIFAMLFYAIIVTIIAVWVTFRLASITERAEKISEKAEKLSHKLGDKVKTRVVSVIKKK